MRETRETVDERAIGLTMRGDLELLRVRCGRECVWNVKDPISLRYFQLREEEHFVLSQLDGRRSLRQLQLSAQERFAPRKLEINHLQAYLGTLHRMGLTVAQKPGQGAVLLERRQKVQRQRRWSQLANPLAIRFPGVDPRPLLDWLYPRLSWLFRRATLWVVAALVTAAIGLLLSRWSTLASRLPDVEAFLNVANVGLLAAALCFVKLLHEAGHALACRHFRCECHEVGVMLLVAVPCLYCNISDTWMLPNKWHRMAISGAGIVVELFIAAICTFVWCCTSPGLVNAMSFNLLVICSVNTLLLNGNPLLRFDGYFILSDLADTPNLWQSASRLVGESLSRFFLGRQADETLPVSALSPWLLRVYGVASWVYRILVVAAILWVCFEFFERRRMGPAGQAVVAAIIAGMALQTGAPAWRKLRDPAWRRKVNRRRFFTAVLAAIGVLGAVLLVPLPRTVRAPVVLVPADAERVYVRTPGSLEWAIAPGARVRSGDAVGQLGNRQFERELQQSAGHVSSQELVVDQWRRRQLREPHAAAALPNAEALLKTLQDQYREQRQRIDSLRLVAPRDGLVIAPRERQLETRSGELPKWTSTPLDRANQGSFLEAETLFCLVGDPRKLSGEAIVEQTRVAAISPGQPVRVKLDSLPGEVVAGVVVEVDELQLGDTPPELAAAKKLAVAADGAAARRSYRVKLRLELPAAPLRIGATGLASIEVPAQSLARRGWQSFRRMLFRAPDGLSAGTRSQAIAGRR